MKFHIDNTLPINGEYFVFGSNLAGRHGAGAAKAALQFGARLSQGTGLAGKTYAIPTKDIHIYTLPIEYIKKYVDEFIVFSQANSDKEFFITRVGCGLAGFNDCDIAPLFNECGDNCSFASTWERYIIQQGD